MSKKQAKKSEQAGLHEKRLADLLKFLSNNETTIKSEGITYTSKRGDGYNHIKDALQQVTGMSEKAYYAYFEDMELGNKFSEMRKVYDTVGKVIHSIRPYLKSDGPIDSPINRLVQEDAFTVDNNPIISSDNPTTMGEVYGNFSKYVVELTHSFSINPYTTFDPNNFDNGPYRALLKPFIIDLNTSTDENTLAQLQQVATTLNFIYTNKWSSGRESRRMMYGYKDFGAPHMEEIELHRLVDRFKELGNRKNTLRLAQMYMKYRYHVIRSFVSDLNYKQNEHIGIQLFCIVYAFEEEAKRRVLDDAINFLLKDTLFGISSSKDSYRSHHFHSDLSLDSLSELLAEYQFNNPASDFVESEYNLLRNPISIYPVYDVAKVGDSKAIIKKELTKTVKQLYLKKISKDLGMRDNFEVFGALDPKVKNVLVNAFQGMKM
ncbi:MAG: hypothetical protein U5K71_11430 [Gracilimonas sp.]|nr:hypothetical protein [Gracilimonas sp.]